jgi:hypothetical protein
VLADGVVVGRILEVQNSACRFAVGCGRSPLGITKTARRRTATSRRARPRWPRSPGVGGGSDQKAPRL